MKKALLVATVGDFIACFELNDIKILQDKGFEVHGASNFKNMPSVNSEMKIQGSGLICHQINFVRNPFDSKGLVAYRQLKRLMETEHFDLVHCHTPMGGVLGRICASKYRKKGTKVIYTVHGFHFFKGAPIKNWLIYYPIEKICSYMTDMLITINREDYALAQKKMHAKHIEYVPGVGVDTKKFQNGLIDVKMKRSELGISDEDILLLSVGELSSRKNHVVVIKALSKIRQIFDLEKIYYFICGTGGSLIELQKIVHEMNLDDVVQFLGFRTDISELCQASDLFVFPSLQEGLPVALMEAIACRTPVLCSKIRGNEDLIQNEKDMFEAKDVEGLVAILKDVLLDENKQIRRNTLAKKMEKSVDENYHNLCRFELSTVKKQMNKIYGGG